MDHAHQGTPSRAAIGGHPLHPMVVPFPIAFLVGALAADVAFWSTGDPFWARGSLWLVGAGLVSGVLAAVLGLIDFVALRQVRSHTIAWVHFIGNAIVLLLASWSLLVRLADAAAAVLPLGIVLSALMTAILLVTGWLGGELAYRHKIGVVEAPSPGERREEPGSARPVMR